MRVSGWVSLPGHYSSCLQCYSHSLGAVQTVAGVIEGSARAKSQAEAIGGPDPSTGVSPVVVGILGGLSAALGCDGDERLRRCSRWNWRRGLLIARRVGDSWKRQ